MAEVLLPITKMTPATQMMARFFCGMVFCDKRTIKDSFAPRGSTRQSPNRALHLQNVGGFRRFDTYIYDNYDAVGSAGYMDATVGRGSTRKDIQSGLGNEGEEISYSFIDGILELHHILLRSADDNGVRTLVIIERTPRELSDEEILQHMTDLQPLQDAVLAGEGTQASWDD